MAATYWGFRLMVGMGGIGLLVALAGLLLFWKRRLDRWRLYWWIAILAVPTPFVAVTAGWI